MISTPENALILLCGPALWPRRLHPREGPTQLQHKMIDPVGSFVTACPRISGFVWVLQEVTFWQEGLHSSIISLLQLIHQPCLPRSILGPSCLFLSRREFSLISISSAVLTRNAHQEILSTVPISGSRDFDSVVGVSARKLRF